MLLLWLFFRYGCHTSQPNNSICMQACSYTTLLQNRFIDFPIEFWCVRPCGYNEAILEIVTKAKKELQIKIGEGYCRLFRTRDGELRDLEEIKFSPMQLVQVCLCHWSEGIYSMHSRNCMLVEFIFCRMSNAANIWRML